jgi:hypothetical protein
VTEPKFKFDDKVNVIFGFYRKQSGTVKGVISRSNLIATQHEYFVQLKDDKLIKCDEEELTPRAHEDHETKVLTDDEYQRRVAPKATTTSEGEI